MLRSPAQPANERMPVHPRIVRYVVVAFLIGSLVRVCMGSTDVVGFVEGQRDHFSSGASVEILADH